MKKPSSPFIPHPSPFPPTPHPSPFSPPPLTSEILNLVEQIGEALGVLTRDETVHQDLRLRRASQVRSVQSSLQIEGNTLSLEQVTAVLEGKRVLGSPREIQEIRNAIEAYEKLGDWNPEASGDLLVAHGVLMRGLVDDPGQYRSGSVGVQRGEVVVHIAPPASLVPSLVKELVSFLRTSDLHPLVKSSVFHYEFEFIHPFSDGNGRLGRLWQTAMLCRWKPIFAVLPVESVIRDRQQDYYAALNQSNGVGHSGPVVSFLLKAILQALESFQTPVTTSVTPPVKVLLKLLSTRGALSNQELLDQLQLKDRRRLRDSSLTPALEAGLIEYTIPGKPTSRNQQYRLTPMGRDWISSQGEPS